jgi:hypothetical protein
VLQQHRLPPALGCVAETLLAVQTLSLLEKTFRLILVLPDKMPPRDNVLGDMQRVPDTDCTLKTHQPLHKHFAQCSFDKHRPPLLYTNVDAVNVPLLCVSVRRSATAEHDLPALHAASRRQTVQGMDQ